MLLYQDVTNVSLESFREMAAGKKVILLYPWTNYRNLFLSYFMNDIEEGLLYYRIPENTNSHTVWLQALCDELDSVLEGFGHNLSNLLPDGRPDELGRALAADLGAIQLPSVICFLDELDRVPHDDDFELFIRTLVDALPDHVQLTVNSRLLTYQPWIDMVDNGFATVMGTAFRRDNLLFTAEDSPKPQLEVYAFGRGHVLVNGREIVNWDGALPRNLFFYFVDNKMVTRNEIFDVFWPKLSVKEATNVFHVTKRKITERISSNVEDADNYELTQYTAGFYQPSKKVVRHYDVEDFEEAINQAAMVDNPREREHLYRRAIEIYKAPFLQTIDMPWVEQRREKLRHMYSEALIGVGRLHRDQERYEEALGFFIRALREMPQREDIYREVMIMYSKLGRRDDAIEHYHMLERHLDDTVGVPPSKETRRLFTEIQGG